MTLMKFKNPYTVEKTEIEKLRNHNKLKLSQFGNLGTSLINPLLLRFLECEDIAVKWSCEGYPDGPKFKFKIPHIGFLVTEKGLEQLLAYLENCRKEIAITSEYWFITFQHSSGKDKDLTPCINWSLNSFINHNRREFIFQTMCDEFDVFFKQG